MGMWFLETSIKCLQYRTLCSRAITAFFCWIRQQFNCSHLRIFFIENLDLKKLWIKLYYLLFPMILPEFLNLSFFYYWQNKHWDWDVKQKTWPNWISQAKRGGERQMGKLPTAHKFCQVFALPIPEAIKHWKTRAGNNFSWCAPINGIHSFHDNVNGHASIGGVKTQSAVDRVIMSWHKCIFFRVSTAQTGTGRRSSSSLLCDK